LHQAGLSLRVVRFDAVFRLDPFQAAAIRLSPAFQVFSNSNSERAAGFKDAIELKYFAENAIPANPSYKP
jgi:hypothetical protein